MTKRNVITNLPIKLPIQSTVLYSFLLHYFNASGIIWGVFITLCSILWILILTLKWNEVKINLEGEKPEDLEFKNKLLIKTTK